MDRILVKMKALPNFRHEIGIANQSDQSIFTPSYNTSGMNFCAYDQIGGKVKIRKIEGMRIGIHDHHHQKKKKK